MSKTPVTPRHLEQLFQNLEDGCLSGAEHAELMDRLRHDAGTRKAYVAYMRFASMLHAKAEALAELEGVSNLHTETPASRQFTRSLLAAAAVVALVSWLATFLMFPPPPRANVAAGPGAMWSYASGGIDKNGKFVADTTLELEAGSLELTLSSGSELVVEGPARLLVQGPDEVRMPFGRLWARAKGERFTVSTGRLRVIDLGTEFGVIASRRVDEEVHVAEGRVLVRPFLKSLPEMELTAGQSVRANAIGKLRRAPYEITGFQTELPKQAPFIHWSFDRLEGEAFPSSGFGLPPGSMAVYDLDQRRPVPLPLPPSLVPGRFGSSALALTDPSHFAQADFAGISGDLPRTVAFWVKAGSEVRDRGNSCALISWGLASDHGTKWVLTAKSSGAGVSTGWGGSWAHSDFGSSPGSIFDDRWHHLAYVFTGRTDHEGRPEIIHYRDGQPIETSGWPPESPVDTDCSAKNSWPLTIGTQLFSNPIHPTFTGAIDELYVFRGALTEPQIRSLMERNKVP